MAGKKAKKKSTVQEYIEAIAIAFVLAFITRQFVIQTFRIPSGSMEDTLLVGDFLIANKFIYGAKSPDHIPFTSIKLPYFRLPAIREPKPGDIIIFKYPHNPSRDFIKRVIAVEGQTIEIRDKAVYVDGRRFPDPPKAKHTDLRVFPGGLSVRDNFGPVRVPPGKLFVMGDNRDNSRDSRYWGWVPRENIKGKAMILYWSWHKDVPLWDIAHKIRWERIGDLIR